MVDLQEILSRVEREAISYKLDFDFGKVLDTKKGFVKIEILTRTGILDNCLVLDYYFPKKDDTGIIIYVGKNKYPCFYPLFNDKRASQSEGELTLYSASDNITTDFKILSKEFLDKAKIVAQQINTKLDWLLLEINFESSFNPKAISPTGAVGLIQWTSGRANEVLGLTQAQILQKNQLEQLDLIQKDLINYKGRLNSLQDLAMSVFAPAFIGKNGNEKFPDFIIRNNNGISTPNQYVALVLKKGEKFLSKVQGKLEIKNNGIIELSSTGNTK